MNEFKAILDKIRTIVSSGRRVMIITELKSGDIIGIYETLNVVLNDNNQGNILVTGKEITDVLNKLSNISILSSNFSLNYSKESDLLPYEKFYFSVNQFGYVWCVGK